MILVTLGTQDKDFSRLLRAVEKEIKAGNIKDEVIVQAGHTKYSSTLMEIFDFISAEELEALVKQADIIITHGGVGSITTAIKYKKKIIAAARLKRYKEHTNDHQVQIIKKFAERGYLLPLLDFHALGKLIKKARTFKVKDSFTNESKMPSLIEQEITKWTEDGTLEKGQKFREVFLYLIFGGLTTMVNIISYFVFVRLLGISYQVGNVIAWLLSVAFAFITNKTFVFESKNTSKSDDVKELVSFFGFRIVSLIFDLIAMYIMIQIFNINDMVSKVISNIFVIVVNYVFSKLFIFKK